MPKRAKRGRRSPVRGVSVERRAGAHGDVFIARYTTPDGRRPSLPAEPSWDAAFEAARIVQDKLTRARYRDPRAAEMSFTDLVTEHYLPTYAHASPITRKNLASHLGNGTGQPARAGAKNARAARFALLFVFGATPIAAIGPQQIRVWQAGMVREGYSHASILAKRSVLSNVLEIARANGWIELNPLDAVTEPPKQQTHDEDRAITPPEWTLIRARIAGETALLLVDVTLDTGLRFGEITGLRPRDLIDADGRDPQHLWVRQEAVWPGRAYSPTGEPWYLKGPKGRRWRKVAVSPDVFTRLLGYVERYELTPDALVFDCGRIRAERSARRDRDPLPTRAPHGRYVNPRTNRSGEHGRYTTYSLGCRCPFCRNAYSEYRFWWARQRGRKAASPWTEPGFVDTRRDAVDPIPHQWFNSAVWEPAITDADLGWAPTFHDLRHAMITWSLEGGASPRAVQHDAGHASMRTTDIYVHRLDSRVSSERLPAMATMYARMHDSEPGPAADPTAAIGAAAPAGDELRQVAMALVQALSAERLAQLIAEGLTTVRSS
jgi:integrase